MGSCGEGFWLWPRRRSVARLVKRGEEHFYICRKEVRERLGTPVPRPLGFIAWTCSSKGGQGQWGGPLPAHPPCCWQAPDRRSGRIPALPYPPLEKNPSEFPVSVSIRSYKEGELAKSVVGGAHWLGGARDLWP